MKDDYAIVKRLKVGETVPAGSIPADLVRTSAGVIHVSTADGPKELVHSANINIVLQAAGGAGWEKMQATTANYAIVRPTSGASLDLHIETGGTLAALTVANWPIPAAGVDQLRIRNMSAIAQSFTATGFSGIVTADGNAATSGSYSIPVDMAVHITIDEDGWIQVTPMGQEVSQAELDSGLAGKASTSHAHTGTYEPANTNIQTHVTQAHAPSTAEQNVNPDWNAASGDAQILNKPTIPAAVTVNNTLTSTSTTDALSAAQGKALQDAKQTTLVSGTSIKTVEGQSLLGSGNITPNILLVTSPIAIRITGAAGAGTNYQTKITIGESAGATGANFNLNAAAGTFPSAKNGTCSFLFWDSIGAVPFWIEKVTGTTPNRVAHIWVLPNIDLSSGTQTVFLTTAASNIVRSNGESVFTLFDDFDGASVDTAKWDTSVLSGQTLASSVLSFGGGNTARRLLTLNNLGDGVEIMALLRASDTNASTSNFGFVETGAAATTFNYRNVWDSASAVMVGTSANTLATNIDNGAGVRQVMRIGRAGGAGRFTSENPVNTFNPTTGVPTAVTKSTIYNTYDNSTEIDWVAVKKYVTTEPAFSSAVQ